MTVTSNNIAKLPPFITK